MKMSGRVKLYIGLCAAVVSSPTLASEWAVSGYAKSYLVGQTAPDVSGLTGEADEELFQSQNALRLMFSGAPFEGAAFEFHYEAKPIFSSKESIGGFAGLTSTVASSQTRYRFGDINPSLDLDGDKSVVLQNIDRLNLQFRRGPGTLTVGRQAVAFGSARFLSPTDIFEPFLVSTLDREYRVGVDAIRYERALGAFTELDMGVVIGNDARADESAVFARVRTSQRGNDLEAVVILQEDWSLIGGGIERAIGNLGFWGEVAHVMSQNGPDHTRASVGLDKSFGENVFGMIEYHYSSAGSGDPADYVALATTEPFSKGGLFLVGEHYLTPAVTWVATPLLSFSTSGFFNLSDQSAFLRLSGEFSLSDDLYMDFGINATLGEGGALSAFPPYLTLGSEFGSVPSTAYISLRHYF
jgi:hypothetical protein